MAIAPQDNSAFMREVDEEVRKEQAVQFWERWGRWIAVLVIIGLAAFGGWLFWTNQQQSAAETETAQLAQLFQELESGNDSNADAVLAELVESSRPGVRAEALLTQAAVALQRGENDRAVEIFAAMAGDEDLPSQFRDLALIRQTALEFEELEPQAVIDRMAALAVPESPWFGSAGELTAIALMQQGNDEEAGQLYAQMANDESVPDTLRTRAVQMAGVLGVDAVPDEPVEIDDGAAVEPGSAPAPAEGSDQ